MWWVFFAMAQGGFLSVGGVFIKGGSRTLSMKLAKIVMKAGGAVLLGTRGGRRRSSTRRAARRSCATPIRRRPKRSSASARKSCSPIARPTFWRACSATPQRGAIERAYGGRAVSTSLFSAHFGAQRAARQIRSRPLRIDGAAGLDDLAARDRRIRKPARAPIPAAACQATASSITAPSTAAFPTAARRWSASSASTG